MVSSTELLKAARALVELGSPKEVARMLDRADNERLHEIERSKTHTLKSTSWSEQEWTELRAYLLDGGGVQNHRLSLNEGPSLRDLVWQAINDGDQAAFREHVMHLVKACAKSDGLIRPLASGGVSFGPIGSTINLKEKLNEN